MRPATGSATDPFRLLFALERRILVDLPGTGTAQDYGAVAAQLRDLRLRYRGRDSLRPYVTKLLGVTEALGHAVAAELVPPPPPAQPSEQPPVLLQIGLARFIAAQAPIPHQWAFAWHAHDVERRWRSPATRCREEFTGLFALRYAQAHPGGGMILTRLAHQLTLSYRPADPQFGGRRVAISTGLPDITQLGAALAKLHALAAQAQDELEEYSRFLARHPDRRGTDEAFALLPEGLARPVTPDLRQLIEWCEERLAQRDYSVVRAADLFGLLPTSSGHPSPAAVLAMAHALGWRGIGLEPDPRFASRDFTATQPVALFRRSAEPARRPRPALSGAGTLLYLAAATGVDPVPLAQRLAAALGLEDEERRRLTACLHLVSTQPPNLAEIRHRLDRLGRRRWSDAVGLLFTVAGGPSQPEPSDLQLLGTVFPLLNSGGDDAQSAEDTSVGLPAGPTSPAGAPTGTRRAPARTVPKQMARAESPAMRQRLVEAAEAAAPLAEIQLDQPDGRRTTGRAKVPEPRDARLSLPAASESAAGEAQGGTDGAR